jgi:hypothetical protein
VTFRLTAGGFGVPAVLLVAALARPMPSDAASAPARTPEAEARLFSDTDLLWMEVRADDQQLAESMDVYASRAGIYIPLGQFARVLDLAVAVFPAEQRAEGWILTRDRKLILDLRTLTATMNDRTLSFTADQAVLHHDDIYLRSDLVEALLPVRLRADTSAQLLAVAATEPLPYAQRLVRSQRRVGLSAPGQASNVRRVRTPYRPFTAPAVDVAVGGQMTRDGVDQSRQFSARAAGDLAYAGFQGFIGSDERGRVNDVRLSLERKSPQGRALGPLGGVRAGIGDIYTPSAGIGVASIGGRGLFYSSAPLDNLDLSTPLNLRGELGLGEEVELYVNETLRAAQATPVQGRYEFLNVALSLGMNTVRLVFYGAQGQKREEVRRYNLGAGQVGAGQLVLRLGIAQQDMSVVEMGTRLPDQARGTVRVTGLVDYGLSSQLTVSGGFARYAPRGEPSRSLALAGVRGSLGGVALQGDLALDDRGGGGATTSVAARPLNISVLARHSEYAGGFVDETRQPGFTGGLVLKRASDIRADTSVSPGGGMSIPVSLDLRRLVRSDGSVLLASGLRASAPIRSYYLSARINYDKDTAATGPGDRLYAGADATTLINSRIQLRGGLTYQLRPVTEIDSAYALADLELSEAHALHFGVARAAGRRGEFSFQGSHLYRARAFDIASTASYEARSGRWRVGLQLAFALAPDPLSRRYRMTRPGASTGGAIAVNAYVDQNGDAVRQPAETAVSGLVIETPAGPVTTDARGRAAIQGLGDAGPVALRINGEGADDPFLTGAPDAIEIVPRPGRVATIDLPMRQSAEVELVAVFSRSGGAARPISALNLELVASDGRAVAAARTDHAGVAMFVGVPPGDYGVRIQPEQAGALGLTIRTPTRLSVPARGGFVRGGEITIEAQGGRAQ